MKRILLFFSIAVCVAVSCSKDDYEQQPAVPGGAAVSIAEADFHPVGGEFVVAVTSDSKWSFDGIPSWMTVLDSKGKTVDNGDRIPSGTRTFTLKAGINDERTGMGTSREADLVLSSQDGSLMETLKVKQPCPYLVITARKPGASEDVVLDNEDAINFDWNYTDAEPFDNDEIVFTVSCNTDWKISQTAESQLKSASSSIGYSEEYGEKDRSETSGVLLGSWLRAPETGVYEENEDKVHSVSFIPETYNVTGVDRELVVQIEGPEGADGTPIELYTIRFCQKNLRFVVETQGVPETDRIDFAPCHTTAVSVRVDSEIDWDVTDNSSWLVFEPEVPKGENCDENTEAVTFAVNVSHAGTTGNANPSRDVQTSSFVVNGKIGDLLLPQTINVIQQPYVVDVELCDIGDEITLGNSPLTETDEYINVFSSGEWVISEKPSWIKFYNNMSGNGKPDGETVYFSAAAQNLDLKKKSGVITVSSSLNALSEEVAVTQAPFLFKAEASNTSLNTLADSDDKYDLEISSSGEWEVSVSYGESPVADWLSVSEDTGSGYAVIAYNAKTGNDNEKDRTARISVKSVTHEKAGVSLEPIIIDILQRKYTFEVTPSPEIQPLFSFDAVTSKNYTVAVSCSADWTVSAPDWINAVPTSGSGDGRVTVTADKNLTFADRSGTVTIQSVFNGVTKQHVYNVVQKAFVFNVTPLSFSGISPVPEDAGMVEVECTSAWTTDAPDWIIPSPASGNGGSVQQVSFRVENNLENTSRNGKVVVKSSLGGSLEGHEKEISFSQNAFEFDETAENFSFAALNETSRTVNVVCSAQWSLEGLPSWIGVSSKSGNGNSELTVTPKPNYTLAERKAEDFAVVSVLHKNAQRSLKKTVSVSQEAFVFDIEEVSLNRFSALSPGSQIVTVGACLGKWNLKGLPAWIKASATSGSRNMTIAFTAEENYGKAREVSISIESEYIAQNNALCKVVKVSQEAFSFDTEPVTLDEFTALAPTSAAVVMKNTMGPWTATVVEGSGWLYVSPANGSGDGTVSIVPKTENVDSKTRTGVIRIVSDKNSEMYKEVKVSQGAFVFEAVSVTVPQFSALDPQSAEVSIGAYMGGLEIADKPEWISVNVNSENATVSVSRNISLTSRNATVRLVSAKRQDIDKKLLVSQSAYEFTISGDRLEFEAEGTGAKTLTVQCTGEWSVGNGDGWIHPVKDGNTVSVTVDDNDGAERTGTFSVISDDNEALVLSVTVTQKEKVIIEQLN